MAEFVFKRAGVRAIIVKQPVGTFLFRESSGDGFAISTVQNSELSGGTEVGRGSDDVLPARPPLARLLLP